MSVASLSSNSPDLYTILQQLGTQSQAQTAAPSAPGAPSADATSTAASGAAPHHHHGHHGIPKQIETAVTNALQNAPAGSDPNQVIQTAIQTALQQAADGQQANGDPASTSSTQTAASTTAAGSTQSADAFNSLLQSFGVDPKEFQQDFQSAVQDLNQSGTVDFSALFRSFPPGSSVNTLG